MAPRKHRSSKKHPKKRMNVQREISALKGSMRPALKYYGTSNTPDWTSVSQYGYVLNNVAEGVSDGQRTGIHIRCKWVQVNIALTQNITTITSPTQTFIRVVLMIIKELTSTAPEAPFLPGNEQAYLAQSETGTGVVSNILNVRNPTMYSNYTVLHDKVYTPDTNSDTRTMSIRINKRLNLNTDFYQTPPGGAIQKGQLYLMFFRDVVDTTTTLLTTYNSRVFYTNA